MKRVAGLAAGAVWLLAAMPALAQPQPPQTSIDDLSDAQVDELYCVYDYLDAFADREALTEGYIAGDPNAVAYKEQIAEVERAVADCNVDYEWTENRREAASILGLYGVMGDELDARLASHGLTLTQIKDVYGFIDAMPADDLNMFVDGRWVSNEGLLQRLKTGLAAKGVAGDAVFRDAAFLAESYIIVSLLTREWLNAAPKS